MKYKGKRIGLLTPQELSAHTKGLALKVTVITGWQLPDSPEYITIFEDQLKKKLVDSYQNITIDEFEYAMRQHGTKIKDWGKGMNLATIDEAINAYLAERSQLSELEEKIKKQLPEPAPVAFDEDAFVEQIREVFLQSRVVGLIPVSMFDILVKREELVMDTEEKAELRAAVEKALRSEAELKGLKAVKELTSLKNRDKHGYEVLVRNECKRRAVAIHFLKMNEIDNF